MKIKKETKIGIIVIIALGLLYIGMNFLKGNYVFGDQRTFYGLYTRVNGLEKSNPVKLNGYQIGQVQEIKMLTDKRGVLLVKMVINEPIDIPKDSKARVQSSDLLGSMEIGLNLGISSKLAQPGDTLSPLVEADLKESVNAQLRPLKNKTEGLISSVDSVLTIIQQILNDTVQGDLTDSFRGIRNAIANIEQTSQRLDNMMEEESEKLGRIFDNVENITETLSGRSEELDNIITNFSAVSDTLAKANIAETISKADEALAEVKSIVEKINRGEGSLGLLINDDEMYKNLEQASDNLDLLMEDIRVNPNRYVHFSVFGRKNKNVELTRKEIESLKQYIEEEEK